MLDASHLVKRFFGVTVVDDVSFVVRPGEVVGYLGPNGSGKTTTALMLTGLLDTTSGTLLFEGRRTDDDPIAFRRRLGYVPEEPRLYPFLSGREHLQLIGRLREMPAAALDRKITRLLDLFGLTDAAEQDIASYSKGMRQKVLVIGALMHDPDILISTSPIQDWTSRRRWCCAADRSERWTRRVMWNTRLADRRVRRERDVGRIRLGSRLDAGSDTGVTP